MLTKEIWQNEVLPKMGVRLGIKTTFNEMRYAKALAQVGINTDNQLVPYDTWSEIIHYYAQNAPDSFPKQSVITAKTINLFKETNSFNNQFSSVSLLHYDDIKETLLVGDGLSFKIFEFEGEKQVSEKFCGGAPSHYSKGEVITMGNMPPHDRPTGVLYSYDKLDTLINGLKRPVHFSSFDFNGDGIDDKLISSFGNLTGDFSIYYSEGKGFKKKVLISEPGAIRSQIADLDSDGLKDVIVLMAQGREGIFWFKNLGNGQLSEKRILMEFQPSYGSSYFDLVDLNADQKLDIIYVNGDNGDYKPLHKPYHGIHLFLNQSTETTITFAEDVFLPYNGVYKAVANDFDLDGDLDIAAISYFPNYNESVSNGFRYYENIGNLEFEVQTGNKPDEGKWLVMEVADIDGDEDSDIILGHSNMMTADVPSELKQKWIDHPVSIKILENKTY